MEDQAIIPAYPLEPDLVELDDLKAHFRERIANLDATILGNVQSALQSHPSDPELLLMAALAAIFAGHSELSLRYEHRFSKRFFPMDVEGPLLRALALAQARHWPQAGQIIKKYGLARLSCASVYLPVGWALRLWVHKSLSSIERAENRRATTLTLKQAKTPGVRLPEKSSKVHGNQSRASRKAPDASDPAVGAPEKTHATLIELEKEAGTLPDVIARVSVEINLPQSFSFIPTNQTDKEGDVKAFRLRYELSRFGLMQGFDELLCLPTLRNVEAYWYQTEAVRKVLKQFRGRVLLADEVGLGKTIEAGMALKEYLLRGMATNILILTPATLVKQWQEEMQTKFGLSFASSNDSLLRREPSEFWRQPLVIASIATARRPDHLAELAARNYDLVVVDEAHHLKNRQTQNWKLVNALQKRFLILLSATPVQNNLIELYNLLTLLKPGIFKTEKEFRQNYMTVGRPRVPANRERMRDLMRDVMIRNTRSLVDVRLPSRHAVTTRIDPSTEEAACYAEMNGLMQKEYENGPSPNRLALRYLLSSAGSSPSTAANAISRFSSASEASNMVTRWNDLRTRYDALALRGPSSKEAALLDLLHRNEDEKKIVFVHHRETMDRLAHLLEKETVPFVRFEGKMTSAAKDAAVARFQAEAPLLLSTESGGEGRNLQFCNTLINFDLPWNPMTIEQRIGRIHRIGQTREVFIFNLVVRGTVEERVLSILDEKINMFELVVGEIDQILGEMNDEGEFAERVFKTWVETTDSEREIAFDKLGQQMVNAMQQYEAVKQLDEELFGDEFVAG